MFAREGRGGGAVPAPMLLLAAKGSLSNVFGVGVLSLRPGGGLWSELRTRGGDGTEFLDEVGEVGGGGACLTGTKGSWKLAAAAACKFASARRSLYSCIDSLEGR